MPSSLAPNIGTAHLAVLHHGLWGSSRDLCFVEARLIERGWLVLNSTCNSERYTYDGIDVCGDRLVRETRSFCSRWLARGIRVSRISFIGYSLGGLVVRYAIGKLKATGFFDEVRPVNVVTFASPHLGAYRQPGATATERLCNIILPWTLSRTGAQLVLGDDFLGGLPLLFVMAHPEYAFMEALQCFENRILLANIKGDTTVPYFSAAMCELNPYEHTAAQPLSAKYPCIVRAHNVHSPPLTALLLLTNSAISAHNSSPTRSARPPHPQLRTASPRKVNRLVDGLGSSREGSPAKHAQPAKPKAFGAMQLVASGARKLADRARSGWSILQQQAGTATFRAQTTHTNSISAMVAGSSGFSYSNRRQQQSPGQQLAVYCNRSAASSSRPAHKLERLDSTSFLLLLPLFLVVWLFMVALLTLWGMRHYLTRVSVGIARDRSWPVQIVAQACAVAVAGAKGGSSNALGGGGGCRARGCRDGSGRQTVSTHGPSSSLCPGWGSSGPPVQAAARPLSGSSSVSDLGAALVMGHRASHSSEDVGDHSYSHPLSSVADEIRGMAAACAARSSEADGSDWQARLEPASSAQPGVSDGDAGRAALAHHRQSPQITCTSIPQTGPSCHGQQQQQHNQQQQRQQSTCEPVQPRSPPHPKQTQTSFTTQSPQSHRPTHHPHPPTQVTATSPQSPSITHHSTHSRPHWSGRAASTLPSPSQLTLLCKQTAPRTESLLPAAFPLAQAHVLLNDPAENPSSGDSSHTRHSPPGSRRTSSSGRSFAAFLHPETAPEPHLSHSNASMAHPSGALDSSGSPAKIPVAVWESLAVGHLSHESVRLSGSQLCDARSTARRRLQLSGDAAQVSDCEGLSKSDPSLGMGVVIATVSRSTTAEECALLPGGSSSLRSSSTGVEDACSSGELSIDGVDAETHARTRNTTSGTAAAIPVNVAAAIPVHVSGIVGCEGGAAVVYSVGLHSCSSHPGSAVCALAPSQARQLTSSSSSSSSPTHEAAQQGDPRQVTGCGVHNASDRTSHVPPCQADSSDTLVPLPVELGPAASVAQHALSSAATASVVGTSASPVAATLLATVTATATAAAAATSAVAKSCATTHAHPCTALPTDNTAAASSKKSRYLFVTRAALPDPAACALGPALGLSRRQWQDLMMGNLNGVGWQKIHVDTHHYHAHAAIVVRSYRRFPAQEHIVEYLVRQMRL